MQVDSNGNTVITPILTKQIDFGIRIQEIRNTNDAVERSKEPFGEKAPPWIDLPVSKIIAVKNHAGNSSRPDTILSVVIPSEHWCLHYILGDPTLQPRMNPACDDAEKRDGYSWHALSSIRGHLPDSLVENFPNNWASWGSDRMVAFVVSTQSGSRGAPFFMSNTIVPLLRSLGKWCDKDYIYDWTKSEDTITELATDIYLPWARDTQAPNLHIVMLSGDGGIIDLVNAFYSNLQREEIKVKKPILTLLPFGTGNALSNSLNYTTDDTYGLRTMAQGKQRPLPVFRVTFSSGARLVVNEGRDLRTIPEYNDTFYSQPTSSGKPTIFGCVVCSWGLHAALVADSDTAEYRKFGAERFMMAAKALLYPKDSSGPHPFKGKISLLDPKAKSWDAIPRDTHSYVVATMVSQLEKGFMISPDSRKLDGQMRIVEMPPMSGEELMSIITGAYNGGTHVKDSRVGYKEIDGMLIEFDHDEDDKWRRVCVDGKIILIEKGGWVKVEKEERHLFDVVYKPDSHSDPGTIDEQDRLGDLHSIRVGHFPDF
ncbi:hypothetical protein MBLNU457_5810t1 [Dothideomycetes sp. NU457]